MMLCCSRHAHHVATTEHSLCTELSPERFLSARIGSNQPVTQALCVSALVGLTSISLLYCSTRQLCAVNCTCGSAAAAVLVTTRTLTQGTWYAVHDTIVGAMRYRVAALWAVCLALSLTRHALAADTSAAAFSGRFLVGLADLRPISRSIHDARAVIRDACTNATALPSHHHRVVSVWRVVDGTGPSDAVLRPALAQLSAAEAPTDFALVEVYARACARAGSLCDVDGTPDSLDADAHAMTCHSAVPTGSATDAVDAIVQRVRDVAGVKYVTRERRVHGGAAARAADEPAADVTPVEGADVAGPPQRHLASTPGNIESTTTVDAGAQRTLASDGFVYVFPCKHSACTVLSIAKSPNQFMPQASSWRSRGRIPCIDPKA